VGAAQAVLAVQAAAMLMPLLAAAVTAATVPRRWTLVM
jgi:hypothetical protein